MTEPPRAGPDSPGLEIIKFDLANEPKNDTLRLRAEKAKRRHSHQFGAKVDGCEAGLLSFDDLSNYGIGVVYEILVLPQFRRRGIGTELLRYGERLARSLDCDRIRLNPEPFDRSLSKKSLKLWYSKRGYAPASDGADEFEKLLD
jgi:GNAT superfamily N-acetyltransferase